eukprot:2718925-Amphidinium_carterae.2
MEERQKLAAAKQQTSELRKRWRAEKELRCKRFCTATTVSCDTVPVWMGTCAASATTASVLLLLLLQNDRKCSENLQMRYVRSDSL